MTLDALSRDGANVMVALSARLARAGAAPAAPPPAPCPSLLGAPYSSASYDALSVNGTGYAKELRALNATLEVLRQPPGSCGFFAVNSWTNGDIGALELVAGLVHADGRSITMMEYVDPAAPADPDAVATGLIIGELAADASAMTFEYAGLSEAQVRALAFSTSLSRASGGAAAQGACAGLSLVGTWGTRGTYTEHAMALDTRALSSVPGRNMTLAVNYQVGCRFAGGVTEIHVGEPDAIAATVRSDGRTFDAVEAGAHGEGGSSGVVSGEILDGQHLVWRFTGHRVQGGRSFAVSFAAVLQRRLPVPGLWCPRSPGDLGPACLTNPTAEDVSIPTIAPYAIVR